MLVFRREIIGPITRSKSKKDTSLQLIMSSYDQTNLNPVCREEFDGLSKEITNLVVLLKELHQSTQGTRIPVHAESSAQRGIQVPDKAILVPELQFDPTNKIHDTTYLKEYLDIGDIRNKVLQIEVTIRSIKGIGAHGSVSYADLCIFPGVHYLEKLKTPDFEKYDGLGDPYTNLKVFIGELGSYAEDEKLRMQLFKKSLTGEARSWYTRLNNSKIHSWEELAHAFLT